MDVVMNIAGISTWGKIEQLEHEHWRRTIEIDLMGPISVLECFVPPMIEARRGGHVVNVASVAGLFGLPWHAPYSASQVRPARRLRGAALRSAQEPHRRQPGLPGRGEDAAGRHRRHRRGRSRQPENAQADRALRAPRRHSREASPRRSSRRSRRTATWSSPPPTVASSTGSSATSNRPTRLIMRVMNRELDRAAR